MSANEPRAEGSPDDAASPEGSRDDAASPERPPDDAASPERPPDDAASPEGPPDDAASPERPPDDAASPEGPPDDAASPERPPDDPESVPVRIPLAVEDGWPPVDRESVWAIPAGGDEFVVDSVPVFALDLSVGDVVLAPDAGGVREFARRIRVGTHATFRFVALGDASDTAAVVDRLRRLGASVVASSFAGLWGIDVPPTAQVIAVRAALEEAAARGVLEFEDPRTP
jgi:hypothetical protein